MNQTTVKVKGINYRIGKMPALAQFHVSRRLAPILAAMGITMSMLKGDKDKPPTFEDFAPILAPATEILSRMSDADSNYVIFTCLQAVSREQGEGRFAPVSSGTNLMFDDIDMVAMIRLVVETLKENLWDFFEGLGEGTPSQSS